MGFVYLSTFISYASAILKIFLYLSAIFVSFKAIKALNIY